MYRTKDKRSVIKANSGSKVHINYSLKMNENGVSELVPTGKTDIVAMINSHAESVDIHNILQRFANGDVDALNQRVGDYFDATSMPSNLAESYRMVENGKEYFNTLPIDVRKEYDFNFGTFLNDIGSEHFMSLFSNPVLSTDVKPNKYEKEVIDNVEKQ